MSKGLKRFAVTVVLLASVTLTVHASGPFGTPVGSTDSGSIVVPIFVGGLPLGIAVVSIR